MSYLGDVYAVSGEHPPVICGMLLKIFERNREQLLLI